jgi:hypothetical protein
MSGQQKRPRILDDEEEREDRDDEKRRRRRSDEDGRPSPPPRASGSIRCGCGGCRMTFRTIEEAQEHRRVIHPRHVSSTTVFSTVHATEVL